MPNEILAPPVTLDGVTFTFERGRCGQWCTGWWFVGTRMTRGFYDGDYRIDQRVMVCKPHGGDFAVGDWLEDDKLHRDLDHRTSGRVRHLERRRESTIRHHAPELLEASREALKPNPDKKMIRAAIRLATTLTGPGLKP